MKTRYKSISGTHHSKRTGFWVKKNDLLYFSFKCGFDSLVHKHVDDTSITLQVNGVDFIVDSGFCNYDYSDNRIKSLRTQKSHSGVFFSELDNEHPARFYRKPHFSSAGLNVHSDNEITGWVVSGGTNYINRSITVENENTFIITDSYHSDSFAPPVRRFIVPQDIDVVVSGNQITLSANQETVTLTFDAQISATMVSGVTGQNARGWISNTANVLTKSKCIEVYTEESLKLPKITLRIS